MEVKIIPCPALSLILPPSFPTTPYAAEGNLELVTLLFPPLRLQAPHTTSDLCDAGV